MSKLSRYIQAIFIYLQFLPKAKVVTYGEIAKKFGLKNPRNVGWILRQNTNADLVPCYRVVRANGSLAEGYKFGGLVAQKRRLVADGVKFVNNKIQLTK